MAYSSINNFNATIKSTDSKIMEHNSHPLDP